MAEKRGSNKDLGNNRSIKVYEKKDRTGVNIHTGGRTNKFFRSYFLVERHIGTINASNEASIFTQI